MVLSLVPVDPTDEVITLLRNCDLPHADIATSPTLRLFGYRLGTELVGVAGLEHFPPNALLRSLAVLPAHRGAGIAGNLVDAVERYATSLGVNSVYLLTETAEKFFEPRGYRILERERAPAEIAASAEFAHLCPSSARLMRKTLS